MTTNNYDNFLESFQELTRKPETFLDSKETLPKSLKTNIKELYDFSKTEELRTTTSNGLPELIIKDFDLEQIWQQIELNNDSLLTRSLTNVSKLVVNKSNLVFTNLAILNNENVESEEEEEENNNDDNVEQVDENSDDSEELSLNDVNLFEDSDENNEDDDKPSTSKPKPLNVKPSIVDDEFFKLNEMENFLNKMDRDATEPDSGNDTENSEDDEASDDGSIDFFKNESDGDEGEDDDSAEKTKTAKYKDFFVESDDKRDNKKEKRNKFLEDLPSEDDNDNDHSEGEGNDRAKDEEKLDVKSTLELREERLNRKIQHLEENAVNEKPWQLKGEITAENRPQNSLLQEIVEFDLTSRPAPIITEQTSLQLEDIIKQRIKDKVFDSVERKSKPVDTPLEYKKKLVLDQEKSKESLAQIYEKEFLEQKAALDPDNAEKEEEEPPLHKEIKSLMSGLFNKLDALSNFHFTPKPAAPELKIISNLPAINMEEVAPVAASDATLLAPEEIQSKTKGSLTGKGERTATDKRRERRHKKAMQKYHAKQQEMRLTNNLRPGISQKFNKGKAKILLDKVTKDKNVTKMDESSGKHIKSSTTFFTQLQEEAQTHIKNRTGPKKNKNKNVIEAKKIKL